VDAFEGEGIEATGVVTEIDFAGTRQR
jgi:hypothetical protein